MACTEAMPLTWATVRVSVPGSREHRQRVVGGIGGQRSHPGLVDLTEVVAQAAPPLALQGVGVGQHQGGAVSHGLLESAGVVRDEAL